MPGENEKFDIPSNEMESFVLLMNAPSLGEAERLRDILDDHDIPSTIGTDEDVELKEDVELAPDAAPDVAAVRGVAILVPVALIDEAKEIVADIEDADEFEINEDAMESDDQEDEFGFEPVVDPDDNNSMITPGDLADQLEDDKDFQADIEDQL